MTINDQICLFLLNFVISIAKFAIIKFNYLNQQFDLVILIRFASSFSISLIISLASIRVSMILRFAGSSLLVEFDEFVDVEDVENDLSSVKGEKATLTTWSC